MSPASTSFQRYSSTGGRGGRGVLEVEFVEGDAQALPFPDIIHEYEA